jgi:hypothetical protein
MSTETTSRAYISQIAFRCVTTYKTFIILLLDGFCKRRLFPLARSWEYFVPQPNTISAQFGPVPLKAYAVIPNPAAPFGFQGLYNANPELKNWR